MLEYLRIHLRIVAENELHRLLVPRRLRDAGEVNEFPQSIHVHRHILVKPAVAAVLQQQFAYVHSGPPIVPLMLSEQWTQRKAALPGRSAGETTPGSLHCAGVLTWMPRSAGARSDSLAGALDV
jgi:hypothetical protein